MPIWVAGSNEPEAMRQYAIQQGVPDEAIVLDYAGRSTSLASKKPSS